MTIAGPWWVLVCFAVSVVPSLWSIVTAEGGGQYFYCPDMFKGCLVPAALTVLAVIVGLLLWAMRVTVTIGGGQ